MKMYLNVKIYSWGKKKNSISNLIELGFYISLMWIITVPLTE